MASIKDLEKALRGHDPHGAGPVRPGVRGGQPALREIFQRLFEGGRAELRLVEAEEGGDPSTRAWS